MINSILKIIEVIAGWFSPERRDKRLRARREEIKKELRQLKKQKWSCALGKKVEKLENELEKINNTLSA